MSDPIYIKDVSYPNPVNKKVRRRWLPVAPIRFRSLIWLTAFLGVIGGTAIFGTVHVLFTYTYTPFGGLIIFHRCDYIGWDSQTVFPGNGKCPIFKFLKAPAGDKK